MSDEEKRALAFDRLKRWRGAFSIPDDADSWSTLTHDLAASIQKRLAADTEGKLRKALIDLGWTPPKD